MVEQVPRLNAATLGRLPADVRRPAWDRAAARVGWAHVGAGAFHRGHQADYAEDLLEAGLGCGLVAVNLRPPALAGLLGPQDGLYTRTLRGGDASETRVVGAILRVVDAGADPAAALAALCAPEVTTVTLTVTEAGTCHVPATGLLDEGHADVLADLGGGAPRSVPGLLLAALAARARAGAGPVDLVSCDNVAGNGRVLRAVVRRMAEVARPDLLGWIDDHVGFPATMVDRIVPATTPADLDALAARLGVRDAAAVFGEPFRQWVIEDAFRAPRPPWEAAGAEVVADPWPYEAAKMRVLNAAQTMLSLLGALAGHAHSSEAAADPALAGFVRRTLAAETLPHLPAAPGMDDAAALDRALARIANPAIRHACHQIATDTSRKVRQRLLDGVRDRRRAGRAAPGLEAGVAAWLAYVAAEWPAWGARWRVADPVMAGLRQGEAGRAAAQGDLAGLARGLLGAEDVFGEMARDAAFRDRATQLARRLLDDPRGALAAVEAGAGTIGGTTGDPGP